MVKGNSNSTSKTILDGKPVPNTDMVMHLSNKDYTDFYNTNLDAQIAKFAKLSSEQQSQN